MTGILLTRRAALLGAAMLLPVRAMRAAGTVSARGRFAEIEKRAGGRLGVAAVDTETGKRIDYRSDERFPMCSTFKFLAVAAVLSKADGGADRLDRRVPFGASDLLDHAPVTKEHVGAGAMSLAALCEAAIEYSDNTAANLILQAIGGPEGLTGYIRSLGDSVTRADRTEPTANTAIPGDPRDTTSPASMLHDMRRILLSDALSPESRRRLESWLVGSTTGASRIRAGVPVSWQVGDKTGTGANGAANDIAILRPPSRQPILVAAYFVDSTAPTDRCEAALAEVGRVAASAF